MRPGPEAEDEALLRFADALLSPRLRTTGLIGRGGSGFVVAAEGEPDAKLAVKILFQGAMEGNGPARLQREAEVHRKVRHPGLVRVLEVDVAQGFLVMERIDGEPLSTRLARAAPESPAWVLRLARAILDALEPCHAAGIVHRDIKPSNILIDRQGNVRLADFGVASLGPSELTAEGSTLGTRAYMAPEQMRRATVDGRADLYALGVTLFEAATGLRMHTEERSIDDPGALVRQHTGDPALAAAIAAAVAEEPDQRPRDAAAMRDLLGPRRTARRGWIAAGLGIITAALVGVALRSPDPAPKASRLAMLPLWSERGAEELSTIESDVPFLLGERLGVGREAQIVGYYELLRRVGTASTSPEAWRTEAIAAGATHLWTGKTRRSDAEGVAEIEAELLEVGGLNLDRFRARVPTSQVAPVVVGWAQRVADRLSVTPRTSTAAPLTIPSLSFARGRAALERQEFPRAITELRSAVEEQPLAPDPWFYLAVAAWWQELDPREVGQIIEGALGRPQPAARRAFLVGLQSFQTGDYPTAAARFTQALETSGDEPYLVYGLGEALFHSGRIAEGVQQLRRSIDLAPAHQLGLLHVLNVATLRRDRAALEWGLAHTRGVGTWDPIWRARIHVALGDRAQAERELQAEIARKASPLEYAYAIEMLIELRVLEGRPEIAEILLDQLELTVATHPHLAETRCALRIAQGDPGEACRANLARIVETARSDPALALNEAYGALELTVTDGAVALNAELSGLISRLEDQTQSPGRFALGQVLSAARSGAALPSTLPTLGVVRDAREAVEHERRGQHTDAAQAWRRAIEALGDQRFFFAMQHRRGAALLQAGAFDAALEACDAVLHPAVLSPGMSATLNACFGVAIDANLRLGRIPAARSAFDQAAALRRRAGPRDALLGPLRERLEAAER